MLILSRKQNEAIRIGENIELKILEINGDQVKIGINAPQSINIHRQEVYIEIQKQNSEAANVPQNLLDLLNNNPNRDR